jgi:truncated hemoglobin YjbI
MTAEHAEAASHYERVGGEPGLRALIDDFVGRVVSDIMIGFMFRDVDRVRLARLELEHATAHLGGPSRYSGRPLRQAHAKHRVMGGQFARRKELLRKTLVDHGVAQDIIDAWLAHTESLREQVTTDPDGQCND